MNDRQSTSLSDEADDFEALLRARLHELADQAPLDAVPPVDELALRRERRGRSPRRVIGIAASVAALAGAGIVTATVVDREGIVGAASPLAAVSDLVAALERGDASGAVDLFDPLEVSAVRAVLDGADPAVDQLAMLDSTLELGVVAQSSGLPPLTSQALTSDLVVFSRPRGEVVPSSEPGARPTADVHVATVRREDRWFVSLQYTIAETARRAHGLPFPPEPELVPRGSASALAAAERMYASLLAGDFTDLAASAAPGEGDAMLRYASLWVPAVQSGHDAQHLPGDRWSLSVLEMSGEQVNGRATLVPTVFTVEGTIDPRHASGAPISSDPIPFTIEHRDGCTTLIGADAIAVMGSRWLPAGSPTPAGDLEACGAAGDVGLLELLSGVASGTRELSPAALPPLGVVEMSGSWYLSPLGTVAAGASASSEGGSRGASPLESVVDALIGVQSASPITTSSSVSSLPTTSLPSPSTSSTTTSPTTSVVTTVPGSAPPPASTSTTVAVVPSSSPASSTPVTTPTPTTAPRPPSSPPPLPSVPNPPATVTPPTVTSPPFGASPAP